MFLLVYVKVGETEKIDITGNVDTINIPQNTGTVSLMLFLVPIDKFTSKINLGVGFSQKSVFILKLKTYVVNLLVSLYPHAMLATMKLA